MWTRIVVPFSFVTAACCAVVAMPLNAQQNAQSLERYTNEFMQRIRNDPVRLTMFLRAMPKGGDLHNHLYGAVYAERLLEWASADGLCISGVDFTISFSPCDQRDGRILAAELLSLNLYEAAINAFSMRGFVPGSEPGHDHFFSTFAKFDLVGDKHGGDMLAEAIKTAADDRLAYIELMWGTPGMDQARRLGSEIGELGPFDTMRSDLLAKGLRKIVADTSSFLDSSEMRARQILSCEDNRNSQGCQVVVRYLGEVIRSSSPSQLFSQCLFLFELVNHDKRVVGINLVAPEDDPIALRDYTLHMRILQYLSGLYPNVQISLHAGELTLGLVPPSDLRFHIRQAVEIGMAKRIGHGVSVMEENDAVGLLREMAQRRVLVEINLTSNYKILGIHGSAHPLHIYLDAKVPVSLSTDDEGVSRDDLTAEYSRAVTEQGLDYIQLKTMARNSLEFSFVEGKSLWRGGNIYTPVIDCPAPPVKGEAPTGMCKDLIEGNEKARLQWVLESAFAEFEATDWTNWP
jgi:adenosine deaminase